MRSIRLSALILSHCVSLIDVSNFIMAEKRDETDQNDEVKKNMNVYSFYVTFPNIVQSYYNSES